MTNATTHTTIACDTIKSEVETFAEFIDELTGGELVDAGAQLKQAADAIAKADKAIKLRIIDEATDGKLQGVTFKATVVEAVQWRLNKQLVIDDMGEDWTTAHSKQSMSRSVRYGV